MKTKGSELEKTLALTGDQFRAYRSIFNMKDAMKRFISGLIEEFMEGQESREQDAWDSMSQAFGFNNHDELVASGRNVSLDFTSRQLKLLKKVED